VIRPMRNDPAIPHVLVDAGAATLEDVRYLEMIGFRVTDRRQLPSGPHAVVALQPDAVVVAAPSPDEACAAVHEIRSPRRTADTAIVAVCPEQWAQHQQVHSAGADVFVPLHAPGLEWTARGLCAALAMRGRPAAVPGFERRARLGARLCEGAMVREARILLFDAPDLTLLWTMVHAGYAVSSATVGRVARAPHLARRPDLIVVNVDAQPAALSIIRYAMAPYPPVVCVADSPAAALRQLTRSPPDNGDIRIVDKKMGRDRLLEVLALLAPDGDESPGPSGPEAQSRRALLPLYKQAT
jgi:hypothetical protein